MKSPVHMVVVSIIASLLLAIGCFLYLYVYPKKKINLLLLLILISILPLISISRNGTYEGGNLSENIQITRSFYTNLRQGNIVPTWEADYYGGYGYPQHLYLYPLGYYFGSFFHLLGFSYLDSVKLVLVFTYIFSGIFMYLWINNEYGKLPGFCAALLYLFAPYHLIETHFRATVGVTAAFTFIPLVFYFISKTMKKIKLNYIFFGAISYALLILAHLAIAFLLSPLFLIYSVLLKIIDYRNYKNLLSVLLIFIFGFLFTTFYSLPPLFMSQYTALIAQIGTGDFKPLINYFYSPTMYGLLFQGHHGETNFIIGYAQLLLIFMSMWFLLKKTIHGRDKKITIFFLISFFIYLILTQSFTKPIWELPFFKDVYNSWKLLAPISLITSVIGGIVINQIVKNNNKNKFLFGNFNNLWIFIICIFTIFSTILNWGNRQMVPVNYKEIINAWTSIPSKDIAKTLWTPWVDPNASWVFKTPVKPFEITQGKADYSQIFRSITEHEYIINAQSTVFVKENTMFFPGWIVMVNNRDYPFSYQTKPYSGLITFTLPKGLYKVDILYTDTFIQILGKWISLLSFSVIFILVLIRLI